VIGICVKRQAVTTIRPLYGRLSAAAERQPSLSLRQGIAPVFGFACRSFQVALCFDLTMKSVPIVVRFLTFFPTMSLSVLSWCMNPAVSALLTMWSSLK
jgi:hypothetical protein